VTAHNLFSGDEPAPQKAGDNGLGHYATADECETRVL
jgi:hypothetical protein